MTTENFFISTDKEKLDVTSIHAFLTKTYWCAGISREAIEKAIRHSFCFGLYEKLEIPNSPNVRDSNARQVGFARVVTDFTRVASLHDVFVLEEFRGRGLAKLLVGSVFQHPDLKDIRRWELATKDAHGLYAKFGFKPLKNPEYFMETTSCVKTTPTFAAPTKNARISAQASAQD